jgi:Arrestin (or S-antigen), C-terminal domain
MRAWLIKGLAWLLMAVILALVAVWTWSAGLNPYWPVICVAFAGFSFYRSYKAFVEVWRSHLSKRVEIEVTADKDTCLPGDAVNVTVNVTGKEELDIEEGRVALVCANRYVYQYETTDSDNNTVYRTKEATDEVAAGDERILEEKTILPGGYSGHEVAFELPPAAAPSASGEITNVEWKIRVTLSVRGAPDVLKEIPVTVLSSSETYASWADSDPDLDTHGLCDMQFRLPNRTFRLGEHIEGTLILTPQQDFKGRALRVELARAEYVSRGSGNSSETVEASEVLEESPRYETGSSREYAFAMDVPEGAGPCLETDLTHVSWTLRAVVNRRMAFDPEMQLWLNVYNGPTTTAKA